MKRLFVLLMVFLTMAGAAFGQPPYAPGNNPTGNWVSVDANGDGIIYDSGGWDTVPPDFYHQCALHPAGMYASTDYRVWRTKPTLQNALYGTPWEFNYNQFAVLPIDFQMEGHQRGYITVGSEFTPYGNTHGMGDNLPTLANGDEYWFISGVTAAGEISVTYNTTSIAPTKRLFQALAPQDQIPFPDLTSSINAAWYIGGHNFDWSPLRPDQNILGNTSGLQAPFTFDWDVAARYKGNGTISGGKTTFLVSYVGYRFWQGLSCGELSGVERREVVIRRTASSIWEGSPIPIVGFDTLSLLKCVPYFEFVQTTGGGAGGGL